MKVGLHGPIPVRNVAKVLNQHPSDSKREIETGVTRDSRAVREKKKQNMH